MFFFLEKMFDNLMQTVFLGLGDQLHEMSTLFSGMHQMMTVQLGTPVFGSLGPRIDACK